jgi:hypothetical protein
MITLGFASTEQFAVGCVAVRIGARHMKHAGTTEGREAVGGSSGSSQLGRVGARPR